MLDLQVNFSNNFCPNVQLLFYPIFNHTFEPFELEINNKHVIKSWKRGIGGPRGVNNGGKILLQNLGLIELERIEVIGIKDIPFQED